MKTNKELNQRHLEREQSKTRPRQPNYDWVSLDTVIRNWVRGVAEKPQS